MQSTIQPEQKMKTKKMTTLHLGTSITSRYSVLTILLLVFGCFALSPASKTIGVAPPPVGGD